MGDPNQRQLKKALAGGELHARAEAGLRNQRIVEAIYASAASGWVVKLSAAGNTRGPAAEPALWAADPKIVRSGSAFHPANL